MSFDMTHTMTIAEVMKQSTDGQTVLVEQGYIGVKALVVGLFLQGHLVGLPSMVCQASVIAVMAMTTNFEETVVLF